MDRFQESTPYDDMDEAEEEALLKSDDENDENAAAIHPKSMLKDLKPAPAPAEEEDSLMLDEIDSMDGTVGNIADNVEGQTATTKESKETDSSEEDEQDEDDDVGILKEYYEILKDLEANRYAYDKYLRLCELAHGTADLDNIRNAYKAFAKIYPLSPELWAKYLNVEKSVCQSETEMEELVHLYQTALKDYYSIELAFDLAAMIIKFSKSLDLWHEILGTYGISCLRGRELFQLFREYLEKSSNLTDEQKEELFIESFLKELRLPLWNMEESFIEFKLFVAKNEKKIKGTVDMSKVEADYYHAKEDLQKILVYEKKLEVLPSNQYRERLEVYMSYIHETDKYLNENVLQTIYERMVADCCLNEESWLTYIEFLEYRDDVKRPSELHDYPIFLQSAIDINRKALRNCVWSAKLYIKLMLLLETAGHSKEDITSVLENSMSAGFHSAEPSVAIWLEYLTYLRRQTDWNNNEDCENLRKNFDYAWNYLSRQWGAEADVNLEILKFWGRLEYGPLHDPAEGKAIWNNIMGNPQNAARSGVWIEFAQMELRNDLNSTRHIYRTAMQQTNLDDPFVIASAWERFERCNGSIKNLKECKKLCAKVLEDYAKNPDTYSPRKNKLNKKIGTKRKTNDEENTIVEKKSKQNDNKRDETVSTKERAFKDHENHEIDLAKDHLRIFLSNLDYSLSDDDIREGLSDLKIMSIDLIRSANGKSRGFGYLELESAVEVAKALKMDGTALRGRPLYISSVLRDKEQRQKFKYSDSLEPKKLFVKSLPSDTTKEELEQLFGKYGKLKDVRLVYQKSGKFKNIAYVEYEDEPSAGKAVLATNNMDLRDHIITVAISAPPPKASSTTTLTTAKLLGFNPKRNKLGEQKPRMSLIPTIVRKFFSNSTDSNLRAATSTNSNTGTNNMATSNGISSTSKSNDDFRKLLMK